MGVGGIPVVGFSVVTVGVTSGDEEGVADVVDVVLVVVGLVGFAEVDVVWEAGGVVVGEEVG